MRQRLVVPLILTACWILPNAPATAQSSVRDRDRSRPSRELKTFVRFEILLPRMGIGLDAQRWGPIFEQFEASVTFRQAILDDEPGIEETTRGTFRTVTVTGLLDVDGSLIFPDREFAMSETDELGEWINELKVYGAQGSPEGKPVWGLENEQFTGVYDALSAPVTARIEGEPFESALRAMELPDEYPLRLHTSAVTWLLGSEQDHPVRHDVAGLSRGTALAVLLSDFGLGFRPLRTPRGDVELVVQPLIDISDPWPVGWELDPSQPRNEAAPALFEFVTAGFDDLPLEDVLDAVANASETPILIDYRACAARGIDPTEVTVSYPQKRTAWVLLIRTVTGQARLTREIRTDEAGRGFVFVFPFVPMATDN